MTLLVDTSVWSLAFRRDAPASGPEVLALRAAIDGGDAIVTTGMVLQELLQGFAGPRLGRSAKSVPIPQPRHSYPRNVLSRTAMPSSSRTGQCRAARA